MKIFAILSCYVFLATSVFGQYSSSILFTSPLSLPNGAHSISTEKLDIVSRSIPGNPFTYGKETCFDVADWYSLWGQYYVSGTGEGYYYNCYPDSSVYDDTSGISVRGVGMSFDPVDSNYGWLGAYTVYPVWPMPFNCHYQIDSIYIPATYGRNNPDSNVIDSVIVELVACGMSDTADNGNYLLEYHADSLFRQICFDQTPRFATARYNDTSGSIVDLLDSSVIRQRYAFPLTSLSVADTLHGGFLRCLYFALQPDTLKVHSQCKVVYYCYFKSGATYPSGTGINAANSLQLYSGNPLAGAWLMQNSGNPSYDYPGSYQAGLIATGKNIYPGDSSITHNGHDILIPSFAYTSGPASNPPPMEVPICAFHVLWRSWLSVNNLNAGINITAYPNPADEQVTVSLSSSVSQNLEVDLFNEVGQVVDRSESGNLQNSRVVFNTASLKAGMYYYSVKGANISKTGQVLIAH